MRIFAELEQDDYDALLVTYPGGVLTSPETFVRGIVDHAVEVADRITKARLELSISGAMRWPWSHEAIIHMPDLEVV
jgi:hypothetical protein